MRKYSQGVMRTVLLAGLLLTAAAWAQDRVLTEDFFGMGNELGVGARAIGLGGAYIGVADDYSGMYWNPAGIGQMKRREFNIGFSQNNVKSAADFLAASNETDNSFTRLNSVGLVFPVPTARGSLVFGLGFDKTRDHDGMVDIGALSPDSLFESNSILDEGSRSQFTLSGSVEAGPNLFVGASINFIDGKRDHSAEFKQEDIYDLYYLPGDSADPTDNADWTSYSTVNGLTSELDATNIKLAMLYRSEKVWRLGATLTLPTTYKIRENWQSSEEEYYDAQHDRYLYNDEGTYEYRYTEPYAVALGFSAKVFDLALLSADAEFKDWTQAKFEDDPPISGMTQSGANRAIKREMEATTRLHGGAEINLPGTNLRLRGGVFSDPSPYKDKSIRPDRTFYSGGISFMMDRQAMLDLTYVRGNWQEKNYNTGAAGPIALDRTLNKVVATLSLRF
ncbi:MAG TPA: hypothetical protein PLN61_07005 [bacterium]|nr:hypothetical protein [bacterium]HQI48399.1 hypothetical protein [bacterium]HQJ64487.1 hypothetical protein [bacterium]